MKGGQGFIAAWRTHSDLPHRGRQGCDFSLTERHKPPRNVFLPKLPSHLKGPNLLRINILLVIHDTVFWDVGGDLLRFCQRADPLVIVKLPRVRVFLYLKKHQLRVEQEAALFRQVSRGPLDRENVETPQHAPPLASSCEGDDGIQVFLPFASRTRSTHWRQFEVEQRRDDCSGSSLLPHRAPRQFVAPSTQDARGRFQCPNFAE